MATWIQLQKFWQKPHLNPISHAKDGSTLPLWPNFATMWRQEFFVVPFFICLFAKGCLDPNGKKGKMDVICPWIQTQPRVRGSCRCLEGEGGE